MTQLINMFGLNLLAVICMMVCGWLFSLIKKNVTIADSLWGVGFILIAWLTFYNTDGFIGRKLLILFLVTIWGTRLCIHLSLRNWGKGEDPRYGSWRKKHGSIFWLVSLFKVFILQALFLWVIAFSIQYGQVPSLPNRFTFLDILGGVIWITGFLFEAVGDRQLAKFTADSKNKGKVMDRGLWAYSRHPNYFGEAAMWWGIFLIALSTPNSFWTIISPMVITFVLLKLTGVTMLESKIIETVPEYKNYIKRTRMFIPWFPKQ